MSDFTKEELYEIREEFIPDIDASDFYNNLCNKIQALIDNYCEHKETVCIGGWVRKCTKCGMKFGDETQ